MLKAWSYWSVTLQPTCRDTEALFQWARHSATEQEEEIKMHMRMNPKLKVFGLIFRSVMAAHAAQSRRGFHSIWCWQLQWLDPALVMIDGRRNFNQNGACSIFREVNRLISQPFLPSSLSFAPALSSAHDHFWHWHAICLFPISTSPCSFPPSPEGPHLPLPKSHEETPSSAPPSAAYIIKKFP